MITITITNEQALELELLLSDQCTSIALANLLTKIRKVVRR